MSKSKKTSPIEGPGPQMNPESVSSKTLTNDMYPGLASRDYRSHAKANEPVPMEEEVPTQEQPAEDAQESITE